MTSAGPKKFWRAALGSEELRLREMDTTDDNNRADDKSRRRDSLEGLPKDLGQVLPEPRPNDPAVAAAVLASQRSHRGAVFDSHDRRAARDARLAATATIAGVDWSEWFAEGKKALGFVDPPATKKRPTLKTPPPAGPKARDSGRRGAPRPYGKLPPKVGKD